MPYNVNVTEMVEAVSQAARYLDDAGGLERCPRPIAARACRLTARYLSDQVPGRAVELRIPPFVAVQLIDGPIHTRGEPPNVVQMNPATWLAYVTGKKTPPQLLTDPFVELTGVRAGQVADVVHLVSCTLTP